MKKSKIIMYPKAEGIFPLSTKMKKPKKWKFDYCDLTTAWGPHSHNNGGFILSWGVKGWGFGTLSFVIKGGTADGYGSFTGAKVVCDNECMSREFCKQALAHFMSNVKLLEDK